MSTSIIIPNKKSNKKSTKPSTFTGYTNYYTYFFADYLNYKFPKDICAFRNMNLHYINGILEIQNGLHNINIMTNSKIRTEFINNILKCKKKFIMIPVVLANHQHILLYDTVNEELELFEPYGSSNPFYFNSGTKIFYKNYIKTIKQLFDSFLIYYNFFEPVEFFPPGKGFQQLEIEICNDEDYTITSSGFCVAWSFWYIELRIQNKNISRNTVVKKALSYFEKDIQKFSNKKSKIQKNTINRPQICTVIRDYSKFLIKLQSNKSFYNKTILFIKTNKPVFFKFFKNISIVLSIAVIYGSMFSHYLLTESKIQKELSKLQSVNAKYKQLADDYTKKRYNKIN